MRRRDADDRRGLVILHLGFEDHRRPGSGGGGRRTHEINRRLADRHRVTVVTARYRGARRRIEDGVSYRPLGLNLGYFGSILTYHFSLPIYVMIHRADVVIEDFAAPFSSVLIPLFTRDPTVAIVQWMFAREQSQRYKLPFHWFENAGVRLHKRFIVVSEYVGSRVRAINSCGAIHVIPGGANVPDNVKISEVVPGRLLYLGRIEWKPKGLDLLLEALSNLSDLSDVELVMVGDGPDLNRFAAAVADAGLADRVQMMGHVDGVEKWALLSSATVVVIPSRYETFGLVAVEAMAAGAPVVSFDIPSLHEILGETGLLVSPQDSGALSGAIRRLLGDKSLRDQLTRAARARARRFDWDAAAEAHERVYLSAARSRR